MPWVHIMMWGLFPLYWKQLETNFCPPIDRAPTFGWSFILLFPRDTSIAAIGGISFGCTRYERHFGILLGRRCVDQC